MAWSRTCRSSPARSRASRAPRWCARRRAASGESEALADAEEDDVAVAVVVGRHAVPREPADPAVREVVAEGGAEDHERAPALRVLRVDREIAAAADAEREAVAVERRLEPCLHEDAVAAREPHVALVEPADRVAHDGTVGMAVFEARGACELGVEGVDDRVPADQRDLMVLARYRARDLVG